MRQPSMQAERTGDGRGGIPFSPDSADLNRNTVVISSLSSEDGIADRLIDLHH